MLNAIQQNAGLNGANPHLQVGTNLGEIIALVIPWIFTIAGMVLLIYIIFGGLQLMLSRGDPKAAGAAKSHITNALIGFIIIFIAYWAVQIIGAIFGLSGIGMIFHP